MSLLTFRSTSKQTGMHVWLWPQTQLRNMYICEISDLRCSVVEAFTFLGRYWWLPACGNNTSVPVSRSSSQRIIFLDCLILKMGRTCVCLSRQSTAHKLRLLIHVPVKTITNSPIHKLGNNTATVCDVSTKCKDRVEEALKWARCVEEKHLVTVSTFGLFFITLTMRVEHTLRCSRTGC
jgi:hypothetical protein